MVGALELVQPGESVVAGEAAVRDGRAACMAAGGEAKVESRLGCNNWDAGRGEVKQDGHGHGWVVCIGFVWKNLEEKGSCVSIEVEGAMAGGPLPRGVDVAADERNHVRGVVCLPCRVESVEVGVSNIMRVCLKF